VELKVKSVELKEGRQKNKDKKGNMSIYKKIGFIGGMFLAMCTAPAPAFAQMPGMPYMPYVSTVPQNLTLGKNQTYFVASIYDTDYLPYTAASTAAATGAVAADGTAESTTINVQGTITTTGVTVYIPATATGSGALQAYTSQPVTVPAAMTEDGISRDLILSWGAQNYTSSTTAIKATLKAVGGTLNIKKLDINGGLGSDNLGVLLGSLTYPYDKAGDKASFQVRDTPGFPDGMFGKYDLGNTTTYEHNFLYTPVTGEDGNVWLNNNLGADYANVNSASFSPATQATAYNDYNAYGSLFQWGRKPDGHELISWTSSTAGAPVNTPTTGVNSDAPTNALFIAEPDAPYDWRVSQDDALWATEASANNPCPSGFRVPANAELTVLVSAAGITSFTTAANSRLRFTIPGTRHTDGPLYSIGVTGNYWSGSVSGTNTYYRYFNSSVTGTSADYRADGFTVRCVMNNPTVTALSCGSAAVSPTTVSAGASYSGTATVPYTGGNGLSYPAGAGVASTGVTGLTATLQAGTLASGAGNLSYTISGTPSGTGTATFAVTFGGQSCSFSVTVSAYTIPATITLGQNAKYMVASIYDTDYLPYTAPTAVAATGAVAADGTAESTAINVQGSIPTTGLTVYIPATATASGTLPAFSSTITIPAAMTEDGISRNVTLSWASKTYTSSTTYITATLAAVGGTLNAKKLDINGGIGNDVLGVLLGAFSYPYNNAGNTSTYQVRDIAGIPDRMFGQHDIGNTTTYEHNFIYVPVMGEDGKIWLNNNLGADYANVSSTSFNPAQQATAYNDYHAYGSLFQWGRCPDGHELISWSSSSAGTVKYSTTSTLSTTDTPNSSSFIINASSPYDWRNPKNDNLWQGETGINNPCPSGFRVPTVAEQNTLFAAAGITNSATAATSKLKFSVSGSHYNNDGTLGDVGDHGNSWSSSVNGTTTYNRTINSSTTYATGSSSRAAGIAVRCLGN